MTRGERMFVWTGGVMFAASLAFGAYSYLVLWARTGARAVSPAAIAIDALLVGIFALHHSLFARERVKAVLACRVRARLMRSFYVWIASALFVAACAAWRPVGGELYRAAGWREAAHTLVQLSGIWLIVQAVRGIDPLELAGIRSLAARTPLQLRGPYRVVRHPLYVGWILAVLGAGHMTGDRLTFAVVTTLYLVMAIPWEERSLMGGFGDEYARYTRTVKWRLIPFIY
jgi:protein-S-isoprenylcysteine O-methyltransferase Ste14